MSKRFSAPLERTARLLDLVPYIHAHQGISLSELSEVFHVSQSQMVNDLTTLWMCGLPGYTPLELMDIDFESGYVTISNAATLSKPRSITFDEGIALLLGLDLIRNSLDLDRADLLSTIDDLAIKISKLINMPSALSAKNTVNGEVEQALTEALHSNSGLEIVYHSLYRDAISTRTIRPLGLKDNNGHIYLSAYCYVANDFREFRVDRIQKATSKDISDSITETKFEVSVISSKVKILKNRRDLAERFDIDQIRIGMEFEFQSYTEQWLQRSILASGSGAQLLSPVETRRNIAQLAQSMLDRYKVG